METIAIDFISITIQFILDLLHFFLFTILFTFPEVTVSVICIVTADKENFAVCKVVFENIIILLVH